MGRYKKNENPYAVEISKAELTTTAKRAVVAEMIMQGKKQKDIVPDLMQRWNIDHKQAWSLWRQGYSFLYLYSNTTKEEAKALSMMRLEELFQQAEEDMQLARKDFYNIQLKNIDMQNKTIGLYDKEEAAVNTEQTFNITFGSKPVENSNPE